MPGPLRPLLVQTEHMDLIFSGPIAFYIAFYIRGILPELCAEWHLTDHRGLEVTI